MLRRAVKYTQAERSGAMESKYVCTAYCERILKHATNADKDEFAAVCPNPTCDRPARLASNHPHEPGSLHVLAVGCVSSVPPDSLVLWCVVAVFVVRCGHGSIHLAFFFFNW